MEMTIHSSSSSSSATAAAVFQSISSLSSIHHLKTSIVTFRNGNYTHYRALTRCPLSRAVSCSAVDGQRRIISVESHFCYDKEIPEQIIEQPVGLSVTKKEIGDRPHCGHCQAKGAVLCTTCVGSGLYVDSILECQGIVVKVRCLGCGGTGNIMCSDCGGRGHL
ncbi:unnamed protein product [Amaranthus hypochondriacus]